MEGSLRQRFFPMLLLFLAMIVLVLLPPAWAASSLFQAPEATSTPAPTAEPTLPPTVPPAPRLVDWAFRPAGGTVPGDLHAALTLTFDQPVELRSVAAGLVISPTVSGHWAALSEQAVAFTPQPAWLPDTSYQVGPSGFRADRDITFRTAPWVRFSLPPDGPRGIYPSRSLSLNFSYPMDRASVESALRIEPEAACHLRWDNHSLLLVPETEWALDTTYTVTLGATAEDAQGFPVGQPLHWPFTTRSGVSGYRPQGLAYWDEPVEVTLDRPPDRASVEAALQITPSISGLFEWEGSRVRFVPTDGMIEGTSYEVVLRPSARSAEGQPLLQRPLRWQFTARDYVDSYFSFGYGPNVQVLDAAGPRRIQFEGTSARLTFALYRLSPEQLLATYSSSFKGEKPIPVEGLPLIQQWSRPTRPGQVSIPTDLPPGLYVLTLGRPNGRQDELIVVLTHYTLVLKEAGVGAGTSATHQVTGYASTIGGKAPRAGMAVRLYDRSGRLYGQASTDDQGRFETTVTGDTDPLLALGEVDGEVTLCGFGPEWDVRGSWWDWWGWRDTLPAGRRSRAYVYTDRPIYRPGQAVQVKAIVRADDDAAYSLPPAGTPVTLRLRDARDNVIGSQLLSTGPFGTVYTAFTLAEGGTLGTYQVEVVVGEEVTRQALKVEEYRKPDYEVGVKIDQAQYLEGDTISLTVEARYYFGQPVADTRVTLQPYSRIDDPWECTEDQGACWASMGDPLSGKTDAQGRWQAHLPARMAHYYWWNTMASTLNLEATVEDASGQSVSGHAIVQVHRLRYGASLLLDRYAFKPGEEIPVDLQVRDYQGMPAEGVALTVGVYGWDGDGYRAPIVEAQAITGASGRAHASLRVEQQGWYRLAVGGYGDDETWIWIYDPSSTAPWYDDGQRRNFQVSVDKPSYAVGEVASLIVRSPVTGTALLTLERGKVRRMQLVQLTGAVTHIPLPVEADFAPNLFATVQVYGPVDRAAWMSWRSVPDAVLLIGSAELTVPVPERRLQVSLMPDRAEYTPRDEATVALQVTDAAGRPVQAELSLAVVDEAIYALSRDLSLDPFEAFYGRRENRVRTYDSLKPTRDLGGGGRGGGDGFSPGNPRRNFPDTAYWNPAIVTDEHGRALVTIPLPDSLTRWRLVARAVTLDTRVGEGTGSFTVAQAMVVRPGLPRFLVQGDVFTLTASIHNYSGTDAQAEGGLEVQGLTAYPPLVHSLGIAAGATASIEWSVGATSLGSATVTTYASAPGFSDAVLYNIPVVPFAVPQVHSWAGEYIGEQGVKVSLPEGFISEVTQVEVRLAPSVVPTLLDGLEYLVGYPFG